MGTVSGHINLVSDAFAHNAVGIGTVHALRIGDRVFRNVRTDLSLHALLEVGEEAELGMGRLFWSRWLLRVTSQGQTHRHGLFSFLFGNTVHAIAGGVVLGLLSTNFTSSQALQANVTFLGGAVLFVFNAKAWLR